MPARYEQAFWAEMARLGHVKDKTVVVEARSAEGRFERLPELAAGSSREDRRDRRVRDPSHRRRTRCHEDHPDRHGRGRRSGRAGLVASLARPGANVTGTSMVVTEVVGKRLELVRELMPRVSAGRGVVESGEPHLPAAAVGAQQRGRQPAGDADPPGARLVHLEDLERAFTAIRAQRVDAMLVLADPMLSRQAQAIARLAMQHRVVAVGATRVLVEAGIVASYGPHYVESFRRAASYVDRILRGAPAGGPGGGTEFDLRAGDQQWLRQAARGDRAAVGRGESERNDRLTVALAWAS